MVPEQLIYILLFTIGSLGLLFVALFFKKAVGLPLVNEERAEKVARAIRTGAMTFLYEEYRIISLVILIGFALLWFNASLFTGLCFVLGSFLSLFTGYIGMQAATRANVRTSIAAKNKGERAAFQVALFGGAVMGFAVASIGLLGVSLLMYFTSELSNFELLLTSFGLGASLVAFFARVGGGIYTKSADVGADLVGKIEAGIPEDDPRNPAVVADNVGDCVGDTAGMGADIYESYVTAMVSTIILAIAYFPKNILYFTLPPMISLCGLVASGLSLALITIVKARSLTLLRLATISSLVLMLIASYGYIYLTHIDPSLFYAIFIGCASGLIVGLVTEYYTGQGPIIKLAKNSESGAATNIIYGLSIGMESTVLPVILLAFGVLLANTYGGGLFGVSIAAVAMLATVAMTMTIDAYGPIADNAGGIAEMSHFEPRVREITDKLDALGNTTAAMGKGFAIGSALLAALGIFVAFAQKAHLTELNLTDPLVLTGIFIGATLPFLISSMTMRSVSNAAMKMVMEVRRQFKEIPGLMEGTAEPDYKRCIAISTHASLREMIMPGLVTSLVPFLVWYFMGTLVLGGLLVGMTVVGVLLALMMANGGGAWDNAKKYIEAGNLGGKGSPTHKAAIVGDTVGDPFKDTSGPALNILIKLVSMISLLLVSL